MGQIAACDAPLLAQKLSPLTTQDRGHAEPALGSNAIPRNDQKRVRSKYGNAQMNVPESAYTGGKQGIMPESVYNGDIGIGLGLNLDRPDSSNEHDTTLPTREEALALSAEAASVSGAALEAAWACAAHSLDAQLAWWVGRGRHLKEPALVAIVEAAAARDCARLAEKLAPLSNSDGGSASVSLANEVQQLLLSEERHIVMRQLEDSIRRADVEDLELWLDEASRLGLEVRVQQLYFKSLQAALNEFAHEGLYYSDGFKGVSRESTAFNTQSSFTTQSSGNGVGNDDATSDGYFYEYDPSDFDEAQHADSAPPAAPSEVAFENATMWAQLEIAIATQDTESAFEAVALLESVGELDAETAREVRAEVSASTRRPHTGPQRDTRAPDNNESNEPLRRPSYDRRARPPQPRGNRPQRHSPVDEPYPDKVADSARWIGEQAPWRPATDASRSDARRPSKQPSSRPPQQHGAAAEEASTAPATPHTPAPPSSWSSDHAASKGRNNNRHPDFGTAPSGSRFANECSGAEQQGRFQKGNVGEGAGSTGAMRRGIAFREAFWKRHMSKVQGKYTNRAASAGPARPSHGCAAQQVHEKSGSAASGRPAPPKSTAERPPQNTWAEDSGFFQQDLPDHPLYGGRVGGQQRPRSAPGVRQPPRAASATTSKSGRAAAAPPPLRPTSVGAEAPEREPSASGGAFSGASPRGGSASRPRPAPPPPPPPRPPGGSAATTSGAGHKSSTPPPEPSGPSGRQTAAPPPETAASSSSGGRRASAASSSGGGRRAAAPPHAQGRQATSGAAPSASSSGSTSGSRNGSGGGPKQKRSSAVTGGSVAAQELLGLQPDFTVDDLRTAYKKAAMQWHPDRPAWRQAGEDELRRATEMFQKVKDAYDLLGKAARPS